MGKDRGDAFVVAAPSGTGKTTLTRALLERDGRLALSVSCTTRPPRAGEIHGRDYFFVTEEEFQKRIEAEELLEWAQVHGHLYGTPKTPLLQKLDEGFDVFLDIDWQGARQLRQGLPGVITVFVVPPSPELLAQRLKGRGKDSLEVISRRLAAAQGEMRHVCEFDYLIVNSDFNAALEALASVVGAARQRRERVLARESEAFSRWQ